MFRSSQPTCQFAVVIQLNRFNIVMMEKPLFVFLSEPSYFYRYNFYTEFPMEVGIPDVPGCTNYISENSILEPLYYGNVARFRVTP
jgi:hypothetical protein